MSNYVITFLLTVGGMAGLIICLFAKLQESIDAHREANNGVSTGNSYHWLGRIIPLSLLPPSLPPSSLPSIPPLPPSPPSLSLSPSCQVQLLNPGGVEEQDENQPS